MKHEKTKEMALAFTAIIKSGKLVSAFLKAGVRMLEHVKVSARLRDGDPETLMALDYHNEYQDNLVVFDCCWAKRGKGGECGIYMPSKMWYNVPGRSRFFCRVGYKQMAEDPQFKDMMKKMSDTYGPDMDRWPQPGCGAKFVPYARGCSKAVEFQLASGQWYAFRAARLPGILDDEIKRNFHAFHEAAVSQGFSFFLYVYMCVCMHT